MLYIIILVFAMFVIGFGYNQCKQNKKNAASEASQPNDSIPPKISKEQAIEKLKILASTPSPKELSLGAMCYTKVANPHQIEYICPICNEKTIYPQHMVNLIQYEVPKIRNLAKSITAIDISIDESRLCKKCTPEPKNTTVCCSIRFLNDSVSRDYCGISAEDLEIIKEFLDGKLIHKLNNDAQLPLKNYIETIETILGIKLNN